MTTEAESELEKAAKAWRQDELEKRGENWSYRPRTVNAAFCDGAKWLLEQLDKASYNTEYLGDPKDVINGAKAVVDKARQLCGGK